VLNETYPILKSSGHLLQGDWLIIRSRNRLPCLMNFRCSPWERLTNKR